MFNLPVPAAPALAAANASRWPGGAAAGQPPSDRGAPAAAPGPAPGWAGWHRGGLQTLRDRVHRRSDGTDLDRGPIPAAPTDNTDDAAVPSVDEPAHIIDLTDPADVREPVSVDAPTGASTGGEPSSPPSAPWSSGTSETHPPLSRASETDQPSLHPHPSVDRFRPFGIRSNRPSTNPAQPIQPPEEPS
jgi:hypothetical protein